MVVPSVLAKAAASGVDDCTGCSAVPCPGTWLAECTSGTTIDAIAEFLLGGADVGQECDRIERVILIAQSLLHGRRHLWMSQRPFIGRRRSMIALDHFRPFATLLFQL
jgi:hypothetical protein